MSLLLIIFGLFSGCFLAVLVGFIGRNRNIGFGWAFLLSIIFTPLVGLIITLISAPKYNYESRSWGCLGSTLGLLTAFVIVAIGLAILALGVII